MSKFRKSSNFFHPKREKYYFFNYKWTSSFQQNVIFKHKYLYALAKLVTTIENELSKASKFDKLSLSYLQVQEKVLYARQISSKISLIWNKLQQNKCTWDGIICNYALDIIIAWINSGIMMPKNQILVILA